MALQGTNIADLVTTTLNNVEPSRFTDISTEFQRFMALSNLMKKHKTVFDTGVDFRFDLMYRPNESTRAVSMYAQDKVSTPDVMTQATVPWRHITWNWQVDEREIAMNRSPRKIVDIVLTRRTSANIGAAKYFEHAFWSVPATTDGESLYGVPYWCVKSATPSTWNSFTGTVPSGYTTVAGLNPTTYPYWANYSDQYSSVAPNDLYKKWYQAAEYTDFDTAVPDMPSFDTGDDMGFYTNSTVYFPVQEISRSRNDDLGVDIAKYQGQTVFMGKPVIRVPQLEYDTTGPVYGIQWGVFKLAVLRGLWMKTLTVPNYAGQHMSAVTFNDCTCNFVCYNRRQLFVLANGTTIPA